MEITRRILGCYCDGISSKRRRSRVDGERGRKTTPRHASSSPSGTEAVRGMSSRIERDTGNLTLPFGTWLL
jgi:hypothetical protein